MNVLSSLVTAGREMLLLRAAEERARALPDERRADVRSLTRAARDHLDAIASLVGPSARPAAYTLAREAVVLLLSAHARAAGRDVGEARRDPLAALAEHPPVSDAVRRALSRGDAPMWPTTDDETLRDDVVELVAAAGALDDGLELRRPSELRLVRRVRLAVTLGALLAVAAIGVTARPRGPNVALHKTVTTSGLDPHSPDPAALVDGEPTGAFGVRTAIDRAPWVMIDLGGSYALDDVIVYARGDGNADDGLPMVVELSIDAQAFTVLGRRTDRFSQDEPFRLEAHRARGRYVRLRLDRPGYLALTEVEIHGNR